MAHDGTITTSSCTYPAHVGIQESPPNIILPNLLHLAASIQENTQHTLPEVDYGRIFFGFGWFGGIVCHCMLLGNRWDNESRMDVDQGLS